jgi:hypothetical protein
VFAGTDAAWMGKSAAELTKADVTDLCAFSDKSAEAAAYVDIEFHKSQTPNPFHPAFLGGGPALIWKVAYRVGTLKCEMQHRSRATNPLPAYA